MGSGSKFSAVSLNYARSDFLDAPDTYLVYNFSVTEALLIEFTVIRGPIVGDAGIALCIAVFFHRS